LRYYFDQALKVPVSPL